MIKYFEFKIMTFYLIKAPLMISASRLQMNEREGGGGGGGRGSPKRETGRLANFLPIKLKGGGGGGGGGLNRRLMVVSRFSIFIY